MLKISYIFPSRERPEKVFKCLDNIREQSASTNYEIILSLDNDDPSMTNRSVKERLSVTPNIKPYYGLSHSKVHAINRELQHATGDIICCQSDDFVFLKHGFDNMIRQEYSNGFSGLLHFNDGHARETLCTYSIMDRPYFGRFGYIYHPEYLSVYCDNEATEVAKKLGKYKYINNQIFEHQHPCWGFGTKDALLNRTESNVVYAQDRATYEERKKKNFDIV